MTALETLRKDNLQAYHDLPEPNSKDPAWRFASTRKYRLDDPLPATAVDESILDELQKAAKAFIPETSAQVTLVANNQLAALENFNSSLGLELTDDLSYKEWLTILDEENHEGDIFKLNCRLSLVHPFMSSFGTDDIQPFIRLAFALAISESLALSSGGGPRHVRKNLNKMLNTVLGK